MSGAKPSRLIGAIRLVPNVDSIGIPVFQGRANSLLVPEMDEDFLIARFLKFYNEANYAISYQLPAALADPMFAIADPAPIIAWLNNKICIIEGNADRSSLITQFGRSATQNPVLLDIGRALEDARSGQFRLRKTFAEAEDVRSKFYDVFYEPPVRSQYWVSRYRRAVIHARKVSSPPHPIDKDLRRKGTEWLRKFGTKCDFKRIRGVLGTPGEGVFTVSEMKDICFAHILDAVAQHKRPDIGDENEQEFFEKLFPNGLFRHYLEEGAPKVPFKYARDSNLVAFLQSELFSLLAMQRYRNASQMAAIFFGGSSAPGWVDDKVVPVLIGERKKLEELLHEAKYQFADRQEENTWSDTAKRILNQYEALIDLESVLRPDFRITAPTMQTLFGVPREYLTYLKNMSQHKPSIKIRRT